MKPPLNRLCSFHRLFAELSIIDATSRMFGLGEEYIQIDQTETVRSLCELLRREIRQLGKALRAADPARKLLSLFFSWEGDFDSGDMRILHES